jgi:hypothetical protein
MSMLLVKELAITEVSRVFICCVGVRLVEKLCSLVKFGELITLLIVLGMSSCKLSGQRKAFIMVAFLIIALGCMVLALIVQG